MRMLIATILILAVFFAMSIYMSHYISISTDRVADKINKLENAIEAQEWQEADKYMDKTTSDWDKTKSIWLTFLEHSEIDNIDIVLARLQKFVSIKKDTEALGEVAELKLLIKHVEHKTAFRLGNIL